MGIAVEAIELTQIRRFIGRAIRGYEAVTVNELQAALLCGTMATKLRVVIAAGCRLQSEISKLLQPSQVDASVTQVIGVGYVVGTRLGALFLPVNARADVAMSHVN